VAGSVCLELTPSIHSQQFLNVVLSLLFLNFILVFNFMCVSVFCYVNYHNDVTMASFFGKLATAFYVFSANSQAFKLSNLEICRCPKVV